MQAMEILSLRCHLSLWAIWLRVQGCLDWMKDSCISQHSPPGPQGLWLRKAEEFLNMPCSSPHTWAQPGEEWMKQIQGEVELPRLLKKSYSFLQGNRGWSRDSLYQGYSFLPAPVQKHS